MPLSGAGGERLGTLCLLDRNPRRFTAHDGQLLKNLAAMVEEELNLIELNKAITSLQESETNLEDFMENVGDLIMMATLGGTILYANRAWKERFGYDEADLQSLSLDEIFRRTPEQRDAIRARLQAGESIKGLQMECVAKDGRPFPVESTVSLRFKDGKPYYTRVIMRDVTERRKIEQLKSEAFALASHELRTPLTVMITTLSLIDKVKEGRLPPKLEEFLEMIRRNGDRLMDLVNKYLDVSKIESGDMEFDLKPVALAPAVERALEDIRAYGAQRGIRFEIKASLPGVKVRADPGRLDEVLTNLLSNAAKFSPADGLVSISLSRLDGVASIAVADHGPGIPKDFQARIFGKFARDQSDPQSPARKGTGLGLSIAKAIVEKMGGHIGFETEIEKGTTFSFSLPVLNADADGTMI
jgi:PAS domain S-box-containing protein